MAHLLVVAGHDPSGGAGVDVDRRTAAELGCSCDVVVTAYTDQDDSGVRSIGARDAGQWLDEATERLAAWTPPPADPRAPGDASASLALKLGLLPGPEHLRAAARLVERARAMQPGLLVVLDPVLASSSGTTFLDDDAVDVLRAELLPLAPVLTPNLHEAARLTGADPGSLADPAARIAAARRLVDRGALAVVLKGGHAAEDPLRDLVLTAAGTTWLEHPRVPGPGLRGTGCRHATALACSLAAGQPLTAAAQRAALHVADCIRTAP